MLLMQSTLSQDLASLVMNQIEAIASSNSDFQEAFETYVQQYGREKIKVSEVTELGSSIDPVVVILGRNCVITYLDSLKQLRGDHGSVRISPGDSFIIGRREPQDSKLVAWNRSGGVELQEYNSLVDTIPSRIHGIIASLADGQTVYADLGSSARTILAGQSKNLGGAFVRIYDPGSEESKAIKLRRIFTSNSL